MLVIHFFFLIVHLSLKIWLNIWLTQLPAINVHKRIMAKLYFA